jgi:hypothetical protein
MVGTYAQAADRSNVWTVQIHGYPDERTPYEIVPGRQIDSDTRTEYYTLFTRGAIVSAFARSPRRRTCMGPACLLAVTVQLQSRTASGQP